MKKPYIKKLGQKNNLVFWLVNGFWIRGNLEEEFTNCADIFNFKFIPKNEVWIDRDNKKKELRYFIRFYISKKIFLEKGLNYRKSVKLAEIEERKERLKLGKVKNLLRKSRNEIIKKIHKKLLKKYSNSILKTWIVNGFLVRSLFFLDFTHGGHDLLYEFIPKNEIWIDDSISNNDLKYVLIHELHERKLMKMGWCYDPADKRPEIARIDRKMKIKKSAHNSALKTEKFYKKYPKKIDGALKKEIEEQS